MGEEKEYHRHFIRMVGYDYSQGGVYFVTICAKDKQCLFGKIKLFHHSVGAGLCSALEGVSSIELSFMGKIVCEEWMNLEKRFRNVHMHQFVIMPNHFHGIIELNDRAEQSPAPTVGDIVCAFKSITTKRCNNEYNILGSSLWQRNYYEHIIRNSDDYQRITDYIVTNPSRWSQDCYYP